MIVRDEESTLPRCLESVRGIFLSVVEERTYREIAEALDISVCTAHTAVHKGLTRLAERLEVYRQYYAE
jgi:DNA-directed RNA polymerase specialized sigma24 family protein